MVQLQSEQHRKTRKAVLRKLHSAPTDRMALSTQDGFIIISFSDILFCEAMGNYCRIQLRDQQMHVVSKPLKALTAVLPAGDFIRTHQSYLVRFDDIVSIGSEVILSSGKSIPIARSRRQPLGVFLKNRMPTI